MIDTKRCFDVLVASFGLVLLTPVMLMIALAIKLDSPGPVLYRQQRVGRWGRTFRIRKFRTMVHLQPSGSAEITVGDDPRITRVGRFLRASKLDELPQLIDVLLGSMSLVGPRPEVPRYVAHYPSELRDKVLSVRPGITDIASIHFRNEAELLARMENPERAYVEEILPQKLRYAAQYVETASLVNDLKLLGLTVRAVLVPQSVGVNTMGQTGMWKRIDHLAGWLHRRRRVLSVSVDITIVIAVWFFTYLFRLGFERMLPGRPSYDTAAMLGVAAIYVSSLMLFRVPDSMWRYWSVPDGKRLTSACLLAGLLSAAAISMLQLSGIPRAVLLLHPLFCLAAMFGLRFAYRLLYEYMRLRLDAGAGELRHALVMGAGDAARRLIAGMHLRNGWNVLALLDDDQSKQGARIAGVPVIGPLAAVADRAVTSGATHIIVAMPGTSPEVRAHAVRLASETGLTVLTLPSAAELRLEAGSDSSDDSPAAVAPRTPT